MNKAQIVLPIAVVIILMAVIVPLPSIVLDILISANISLSVVILLAAPASVLATHLTEVIRNHGYELIGRQEVKTLIDHVAETHPKLIEELVPRTLSVGEVQKVLQNLAREKVSIRDLTTIFETLADYGGQTKDSVLLTEMTRAALNRSLTRQLVNEKGDLPVLTLSPQWEQRLLESLTRSDSGTYLAVDAKTFEQLVSAITAACQKTMRTQWTLLCASNMRFHLRKLADILRNEMPISFLTNGQRVPEDLLAPVAEDLARYLLPPQVVGIVKIPALARTL